MFLEVNEERKKMTERWLGRAGLGWSAWAGRASWAGPVWVFSSLFLLSIFPFLFSFLSFQLYVFKVIYNKFKTCHKNLNKIPVQR
jgi:hypothetical protein